MKKNKPRRWNKISMQKHFYWYRQGWRITIEDGRIVAYEQEMRR